jgi:hypothetical protein
MGIVVEKQTFAYRYKALLKEPAVYEFWEANPHLFSLIEKLDFSFRYVLTALIFMGQGPNIFKDYQEQKDLFSLLKSLGQELLKVEHFYDSIGGIIGYHEKVLFLLKKEKEKDFSIYSPIFFDIRHHSVEVKKKIFLGIKNLNSVADIYPVGGAGDRLGLISEETKEPLPTAALPFLGKSLLELLIRDLEAREHLYYKTFKRSIMTPIVMMTSNDKNNHDRIINILEDKKWFKRPKDLFFFIKQISVPMISEDGVWVMKKPLCLQMKPGGHGVLWKLMEEAKAFEWLYSLKVKRVLVRQINNPIAGMDYGLLAMLGYGICYKKEFGFAACPRRVHAAEGTNVVFMRGDKKSGYDYVISNIEYNEFEKYQLKDAPVMRGSIYSKFPANTNILFADLKSVEKALKVMSLPGMILNMKGKVMGIDKRGHKVERRAGRLELMMQNIADGMENHFSCIKTHLKATSLNTFITYNERKKTISTTKRFYTGNGNILETPEGCYLDLQRNYHHLLSKHCNMRVAKVVTEKEYLKGKMTFLCYLHPALGPLYSHIAKKIRGGRIEKGGELFLDIAELKMWDVVINGSLIILADYVTGAYAGRCVLENVKIDNEGINWDKKNIFWKQDIKRKGSCIIILHQGSSFSAKDVTISGNRVIDVPTNKHLHLSSDEHIISL